MSLLLHGLESQALPDLRMHSASVTSPLCTEPQWTPLDRLRGVAVYAAMLTVVAIPIWIAQGFLALLGVTLG